MRAKLGDGIIVAGPLPRDAEFKLVGDKQTPLCKFSIKVDERQTENGRDAVWENCTCWRRVANAASGFQKGDTVFAWGKMQTNSYTSRDGENKSRSELVCEWVSKMASIEDEIPRNYVPADSGYKDLPDNSDDELPL